MSYPIIEFCYYDMCLKMKLFADQIRNANSDVPTSKHEAASLLERLPDEFTIEDAKQVRRQVGKNEVGTRNMLSQWVFRKKVLQF